MQGKITVLGTSLDPELLSIGAWKRIEAADRVILHTAQSRFAAFLDERGIRYSALDALYENCEDFDEHAEAVVRALIQAAEEGDVLYCVFDVRDVTTDALMNSGAKVEVLPGVPQENALWARASGATLTLSATDVEGAILHATQNTLIRELDTRTLASDVKLVLEETYPEEAPVLFSDGSGIAEVPLYMLDRMQHYSHAASVFVPAQTDVTKLERYDTEDFIAIVRKLLAPGGCRWDRAQTHESLRTYLVEEAYEVIDAIGADDPLKLADELGDVLYQIVFHAELGRAHGEFSFKDVTTAISQKLISRHTHIFGADQAMTEEEIGKLWTQNKMAERNQSTYTETLRDITRTLPATNRACKAHKKIDAALEQKHTFSDALARAAAALDGATDASEAGIGEALLAFCDAVQAAGVDPEIALNDAVNRMIARFEAVEKQADRKLGDCDAAMRRIYWEKVKHPQ